MKFSIKLIVLTIFCSIGTAVSAANDADNPAREILEKIVIAKNALGRGEMEEVRNLVEDINYRLEQIDSLFEITQFDDLNETRFYNDGLEMPEGFNGYDRFLSCDNCWAESWSKFWCGNNECSYCLCCPCNATICSFQLLTAPFIPSNYIGGRCKVGFRKVKSERVILGYLNEVENKLSRNGMDSENNSFFNKMFRYRWGRNSYRGAIYVMPEAEIVGGIPVVQAEKIDDEDR